MTHGRHVASADGLGPVMVRLIQTCWQGWVREMYTAVSLVQAKNSENAKRVSEAMERHAYIGLGSRGDQGNQGHNSQHQRQQRPQQARHEQAPQPQQHGGRGPAAGAGRDTEDADVGYVARRQHSAGLSGRLEVDAARQVSHPALLLPLAMPEDAWGGCLG